MRAWMADFRYQVGVEWWVFGVAALLALTVAFLTVSFQAVKAALTDPVKSLKSE
jgi:putative ABC transport system permease protein